MTWDKEIGERFLGTKSVSLSTSMQELIPFRKTSPELGKKEQQFILLRTGTRECTRKEANKTRQMKKP